MARGFKSDLIALGVMMALLGGATMLQPDTSLQLVQEAGVLRVCVPQSFPPLVNDNRTNPGFDISILEEIAKRSGLRLSTNVSATMGRDFNPANWRITRAQCEVVAGGVVTSRMTRSFLETIDTGIENGWVMISKGAAPAKGARVGVYPGFAGLDRLKLSAWLREAGLQISLASSPEELSQGLKSGQFEAAVASSLDALQVVNATPGFSTNWLPESLGRFAFGLGLWKGDVTLKRRVLSAWRAMEQDGFVARQKQRYGLIDMTKTAGL